MALSVVNSLPASQFNTGATATITGVSWSSGDIIVVTSNTNSPTVTMGLPTNANLTFALETFQEGGSVEVNTYIWKATAGSAQSGQTITLNRSSGAGVYGGSVWVVTGGPSGTANAQSNRTEAAFNFTPSAGSVVIYHLGDWNAPAAGRTITTGTGTATERIDVSDGTNFYAFAGEWVVVSASATDFGITSYTSLKVSHAIIEVLDGGGGGGGASDPVDHPKGYRTPIASRSFAPWRNELSRRVGDRQGALLPSAAASLAGSTENAKHLRTARLLRRRPLVPEYWEQGHSRYRDAILDILTGGGTDQTVNAQVADLVLSGVPGTLIPGSVVVTAQPASLTLTGVTGTATGGPVTLPAQIATLTLVGVPGSPSNGGSFDQSIAAQIATLTLSPVAGSPSGGPVSQTAQIATLTFTPMAGTPSGGPVTRTAQVATLTLSGIQTAPVPGPISRTAQVASLTLTGVAGIPAPGTVTVLAQPATLTLVGLPGTATGGPVTRTAQVATLTLVGVPGSPTTPSNQTVTAQTAVLTLVGMPGVVIVADLAAPGITWLSSDSDTSIRHARRPIEGTFLSRRK